MIRTASKTTSGTHTASQLQGQIGEDSALAHLKDKGLVLVERNFRCKGGEIDLVMQHSDVLVFVEVRKRSNPRFGGAAASVTATKQSRLLHAAHYFLQRYQYPPACRFDVVAIDGSNLVWMQNVIEA